jgi:hypothetical protein
MEEEFEEEFYGVRGEYRADCWGEYPDDWAQTPAAATATAQTAPPPLNPELPLPIPENERDNTVLTGASGGTPQFNPPYSKFKPHSKATTTAAVGYMARISHTNLKNRMVISGIATSKNHIELLVPGQI